MGASYRVEMKGFEQVTVSEFMAFRIVNKLRISRKRPKNFETTYEDQDGIPRAKCVPGGAITPSEYYIDRQQLNQSSD